MSNGSIAVASSQNSAVLLTSTEASLFRIPTSFPPKFVTSKPSVTSMSGANVVQAVDSKVIAQPVQQTNVSLPTVFFYPALLLPFGLELFVFYAVWFCVGFSFYNVMPKIGWEEHLRNDLIFVEWVVKLVICCS